MQAPIQQTFTYDKLYRLTSATGFVPGCYDPDDGQLIDAQYNLAMSYDNIHNITNKTQTVWRKNHDGTVDFDSDNIDPTLTYNWNYSYTSAHPHAPTQIAYTGNPS